MGTTTDLLEIARKTITAFARLDEFEQAEWDALSVGQQTRLQQEARARCFAGVKRQSRADFATHPAKARKHYSAMSTDAQEALGVEQLLRLPKVAQSQKRPRRRGAGRPKASSTRSSARSGDSGDSEGSEPPPPRLCSCGCELDISHRPPQARYASDSHAAYARQRRKRDRDRPRDLRPGVTRRDPYLRLDADELERLRRRIETGCRCNGHHIADAEDHHCVKCGHRRGWALPSVMAIPARSAEARRARDEGVAA
jgi:hypothetical protein